MHLQRFLCVITLLFFCLLPTSISFATENKTPSTTTTTTQKQKLQTFDAIVFSGLGNLHIDQSSDEGFTVEAEEAILPLIKVYVKEKTLYIDLKNASDHTQAKINYYLSIKNIQNITALDTSSVIIKDPFKTDALSLFISNLGDANINIDVQKFTAHIEGGGKITAIGNAAEQTIEIVGAGEFYGNKLTGKNGSLLVKGMGIAEVNLTDQFNIRVKGDGSAKYCGQPAITRDISGKFKITALDDAACR